MYSTTNLTPQLPFSNSIYVHQTGEEVCLPGKGFGPAIRDHYLLHIVEKGSGRFQCNGQSYSVQAGQGFAIFPDVTTYYEADAVNPWHYYWIGFRGLDAASIIKECHISANAPIFDLSSIKEATSCIQTIDQYAYHHDQAFKMYSRLFHFFSLINGLEIVPTDTPSIVALATHYIANNYSYPITISHIADSLLVSRSQLFRLFKQAHGESVQEYLLRFRLEQAAKLLTTSSATITETMYSCGFNNLGNFSRQFKRKYGCSPSTYRISKQCTIF